MYIALEGVHAYSRGYHSENDISWNSFGTKKERKLES